MDSCSRLCCSNKLFLLKNSLKGMKIKKKKGREKIPSLATSIIWYQFPSFPALLSLYSTRIIFHLSNFRAKFPYRVHKDASAFFYFFHSLNIEFLKFIFFIFLNIHALHAFLQHLFMVFFSAELWRIST